MSAIIYFLLGMLFLAVCEWFFLKKSHNLDALNQDPESIEKTSDSVKETVRSFKETASTSTEAATKKILDIPAVSKGRAFLERMAAKENNESTASITEDQKTAASVNETPAKQDKSSIKTTLAMAKKVSVTSLKADQSNEVTRNTAVTATVNKDQDDLQKVSGIGPKIEELLHAEDIRSFATLASTNMSSLSAIMQKAGARYALADVSSWPEQAKMLSRGDVEALEMLQQSLKKG